MPPAETTVESPENRDSPRRAEAADDHTASSRAEFETRYETLSQREQEVLRGVAYGFTNREIAEHLGISVKSIETYRYRLSDKLDFGSRAELVRFALDVGLLHADGSGLPETT